MAGDGLNGKEGVQLKNVLYNNLVLKTMTKPPEFAIIL